MRNKEVALNFISAWRVHPQRLTPELASLSNETNRRPDNFYYIVSENGLIDPETGNFVRDVIDGKSVLGQTEAIFLAGLDSLAPEKKEGVFIWISPPYPGRYPCSKAVFYKIAYTWEGQKVLDNAAVLFDSNAAQATKVASEISHIHFFDSEEVRRTPFFFEADEAATLKVLGLIAQHSQAQTQDESYDIGQQAKIYAEMIRGAVPGNKIVDDMQHSGFLGNYTVSCPPTFSEYTLHNAFISKHVENCGQCGIHIGRPISKGYRCQYCGGTYKGC